MDKLLSSVYLIRAAASAAASIRSSCRCMSTNLAAATPARVRHPSSSTGIICSNISDQHLPCSGDTRHRMQLVTRRPLTGSAIHEGKPSLKERFDIDPQLTTTFVVKTDVNQHKRQLDIAWSDGERTSYPYEWLRDCCQCSACFHEDTAARRLHFHDLDLNLAPENVQTNSSSHEVEITWPDEHRSVFQYAWLRARSFRFPEQQARARWYGRHAALWGSEKANKIQEIDFENLLSSDKVVYDWLTTLEETGFALIRGAPHEAGQIRSVASKVAFLRPTNLGETSFEHPRENSTDAAYELSSQELHNDLTYYYNVPGIKLVHCISQPTTSDVQTVQFADGFEAARQLRDRYPEQFNLLSTTKLDFYRVGDNSIMMSRHPTIKLDDTGEVVQINYSTRHRDTYSRLPLDIIQPVYRALKTFASLLYDPQNLVEIELKNDFIYCFNNWRVLHGRKAFKLVPGSEPVIERGYIDWDELRSKRRVLKTKLGILDEDY